jgi:hypothetical protein
MGMKKNRHSLGQAYVETQSADPLHGRHRKIEVPRSVKKSTKTVIHSSVLLRFTWVIQPLVWQTCITNSTLILDKGTSLSPSLPDAILFVMFLFLVEQHKPVWGNVFDCNVLGWQERHIHTKCTIRRGSCMDEHYNTIKPDIAEGIVTGISNSQKLSD